MSKTLFNLQDKSSIIEYLLRQDLVRDRSEIISIHKAGDSNMNFTIRIEKKQGSLIFKQSRPYVEKYPHIAAPEHRVTMESKFYELVSTSQDVRSHLPDILFSDPAHDVLVLEDLGELSSYEKLYQGKKISTQEIDLLLTWLKALHAMVFDQEKRRELENRDMRILNHEHIFDLPLKKNNGLDLDSITPGLQALADDLKEDGSYTKAVTEKGQLYLENGLHLLHGDYYPASWLRKEQEIFIIDAEFSFFGPKEFDLGVMLAHLVLSNQPGDIIDYTMESYTELDLRLVQAFAGIEIMRRLIGVAQLPIIADLEQKKTWLEQSRSLILS